MFRVYHADMPVQSCHDTLCYFEQQQAAWAAAGLEQVDGCGICMHTGTDTLAEAECVKQHVAAICSCSR